MRDKISFPKPKKKGDNPLSILKLNNKIITLEGGIITMATI